MTAPTRKIDWRPELDAFSPYLADKCGVVRINFVNEDCAANQFSSLLKQSFVDRKGNGLRFSIRIDQDFASTHTPTDILDEFEAQLSRLGIEVKNDVTAVSLAILADNEVAGNMAVSVGSITQNYGFQPGRNHFAKRIIAVRDALEKFVAEGGRFMIEFRDRPISGQNSFWRDVWAPLLSHFQTSGMVFVHMLGPLCQQRAHEDAPLPNLTKTLPTEFASNEARQESAYDDLIDVFRDFGQTDMQASAAAATHLAQNLNSISNLHSNLTGVLLSLKSRQWNYN
ncbi:hypothetical protein [Sandarakinorhabdus sp. AAP62]|uniref:hypothetical protein n=1 Tax=Sandarakinorhabdus sp. AAP62 TaxID=1248916 RepID=UPI001266FFC2|nr:hypothetical protein [Sandarakinorhabdus sp. AAP62]